MRNFNPSYTNDLLSRQELTNDRRELVVKSNQIIRSSRYSLNTTEQKILIYIISQIKADDTEFREVDLSVQQYAKLAGIELNGKVYSRIKEHIQELADKSWWIPVSDKKDILFRWIDIAEVEKGSGVIKIKLHNSLKPYLLELRENFTKYELINVLVLKSKYAIRLYELLKSYLWVGSWEVKVKDLRSVLEVEDKYLEFKEFKRRIIMPAVNEINKYTDLEVKYTTLKTGKEITKILFSIGETTGYQLSMEVLFNQEKRLGNE